MDPNEMQAFADRCVQTGRFETAIAMYLHMAEGDPSLDGGSLGHAIGACYEGLGDLHAARYWYGRAAEENPAIELYRRDFERMANVRAEDLLSAA
ncbi:hypothetical protein [Enterovirga sp. CN4-39]|uniref:hypothetical protein n=1 Tax=Enterovirga sp. CN4-39 TaxID=3400910 RepID=UPI003BFC34DF